MESSKHNVQLTKKNKYQFLLDDQEIVIDDLHKAVCIPKGMHTLKCIERHRFNMLKVVFFSIFFLVYLLITSDLEEFLNYIFSKVEHKVFEYEINLNDSCDLILCNGFVEIYDEKSECMSILPRKQYIVYDIKTAKEIIILTFLPICILIFAFLLLPFLVGCWLFFTNYYEQGILFFVLSFIISAIVYVCLKKYQAIKIIKKFFKSIKKDRALNSNDNK